MAMNRRRFLLSALAAPVIVRAASLMAVAPVPFVRPEWWGAVGEGAELNAPVSSEFMSFVRHLEDMGRQIAYQSRVPAEIIRPDAPAA
jgi:hypothetical protein